ncbi:hypothetical protein MLD38_003057 [Melastoma candidum]|uniref:Uncharacterized protein n=1 Tax=Melastoma candidum TaxID=119954 RepID=A0ACB9S202_9MYRT|nr:hypothetical protein MLD38_003057 [Melastoma candidum]
MKLAVEILTGALFFVEVAEDCTAAGLKDEIAAQEDLPRKRLILFLDDGHSGRPLMFGEDEVPLVELGFGNGSHVYLFLTPIEDENSPQGKTSHDTSVKDGDRI